MSLGGWYRTNTEISDRVSAELGFQGEALYSALNRYADNDTGETTVTPERLADRFGKSAKYVRSLLARLCEMRAVDSITRGKRKLFRVNRDHPEWIVALVRKVKPEKEAEPELEFGTVADISADGEYIGNLPTGGSNGEATPSAPLAEISARNKEELDYKQKPSTLQGGLVLQESSRQQPPALAADPDDFTNSTDAAVFLLPFLGFAGHANIDILRGAIDALMIRGSPSRRDAMRVIYVKCKRYRDRNGPKETRYFLADGIFLDPEETWLNGRNGTNASGGNQTRQTREQQYVSLLREASERRSGLADCADEQAGDSAECTFDA